MKHVTVAATTISFTYLTVLYSTGISGIIEEEWSCGYGKTLRGRHQNQEVFIGKYGTQEKESRLFTDLLCDHRQGGDGIIHIKLF